MDLGTFDKRKSSESMTNVSFGSSVIHHTELSQSKPPNQTQYNSTNQSTLISGHENIEQYP